MSDYNKTETTPALCKSHNGRAERDFRVCPSKLSKRELEDLYFTLLENNLDLKKTINNQQDKIKVLSTKVQRMTAMQKNSLAKEPKDCCAHTKAILNEHKQSIADLKNENGRLTERIQVLNMKLCSAKQFTRRSSAVYASTCAKCSSVLTDKNSFMSITHSKRSDNNFKSASSQYLDKDFTTPRKSVVLATNGNEQERPKKLCEENKCRTLIDELKQKIEDLQVELSKAHENYSDRIKSLEQEVTELHNENQRMRSECAASQYGLQQRELRADELASRLRAAEAHYGELSAQLSIEKRKVAELETQVKAADISRSLAKTIDDHITNANQVKNEILKPMEAVNSPLYLSLTADKPMSRLEVPSKSRKADASTDTEDQKASDDSGYTDANKSQDDEKDKNNSEVAERVQTANVENVGPAGSTTSQIPPTSTPKRTPTINFSCGSPVSSYVTVDNVKFDNSIITSPSKQNLHPGPSEARTTIELEEEQPESNMKHEEMIKAEAKCYADSKKWQDINSDLQMDLPKKTTPAKRDSHNSYQVPGPMPLDVEMRKAIRQNEKIAAFKFKQIIEANNKKEHKRNKESQRENKIAYADSALHHEILNKEIDVDDRTLAQNEVPRKWDLDEISMKSTNEENCTDVEPNVDAKRKSTEEKFTILSERSINGMRSPPLSAANVNDANQVSPVAEYNVDSNEPEFGTQTEKEPKPVGEASLRRASATYSKGDTYSIPQQQSRATSPDNTDHEISSLTDLPSEKDAKSPRTLSPGEEKAATTLTESSTAPTTDYGSLSEGQLPAQGKDQQSIGETKVNFVNVPSLANQRMEETLQAISEELARCRDLLMSQRSPERKPPTPEVPSKVDTSSTIRLKRAPASPHLGDGYTAKSIFTLHIGTVVLSDEAVINSRDSSMALTWKFYDQNSTMARMHAGRVVLFDFSTEYDVKVTPQFLDYLRYEEMPLIICELDKQSDPFASCSLPLRDALLHANRRTDMSLGLMAGPRLQSARATLDPLDAGDEVGVLDLWCMLRVDPALLPALNMITRESSTPSSGKSSDFRGSAIVQEPSDDDPTTEYWLSKDLSKSQDKHRKRLSLYSLDNMGVPTFKKTSPSTSKLPYRESSTNASQPMNEMGSNLYSEGSSSLHNAWPRNLKHEHTKEISSPCPAKEDNDQMSRIIVNEVPTTIKTATEMKLALERNSDLEAVPRLREMDNDITQQNDVTGSGWKKENKSRSTLDFQKDENCTKIGKPVKSNPKSSLLPDEVEEPTLFRKSLDGTYRTLDMSKKSVKIVKEIEDEKVQQCRRSEDRLRQSIQITIMWLALNDECAAMTDPSVQRLYVAYSFLGRSGADLETPLSLPKPKSYAQKCSFNFSKTFYLTESDLMLLGHMARCRSNSKSVHDPKDCIVFSVISEPPEDPLGLESCEDIGYAYLYLGDLLAYSAGNNSYTEVVPVVAAGVAGRVCGVLALRVDGLDVVRHCLLRATSRGHLPG